MKRKVLVALVFIILVLVSLYTYKDIHGSNYFQKSGLEKNQMFEREEYYRREIPFIYFRKIGNFYLTTGRFYIFRVDQELSRLFDITRHPLVVGGVIIHFILI